MNKTYWRTLFAAWIAMCAFSAAAATTPIPVQAMSLLSALTDGQHVLMMRHADAPGVSDPAGMKLGDCSTQRNLGDRGRQQARSLGVWLRQQGIAPADVLSSPWCRCMDTAELLGLGPVQSVPALGSFFRNMNDAKQQTNALARFLADRLKSGSRRPMILVTHQVNISAYTGEFVGQGDVLLVKIGSAGQYLSHRAIPVPDLK